MKAEGRIVRGERRGVHCEGVSGKGAEIFLSKQPLIQASTLKIRN